MISAALANDMTIEMAERTVEEIFKKDNLLSDIEKLIIDYAEDGYNYCDYRLSRSLLVSWSDIISEKSKPIIKEIESFGYKVVLFQCTDRGEGEVYIRLYWGKSHEEYSAMMNDKSCREEIKILYYTIDITNERN